MLRRKHVSVTEREAADVVSQRDGDRMNDSSRCYSCRCYSCRVRNAGIVNTYEGAAKPTAVSEISPGLFVHAGVMELMTRGNEGAIANVGFVIGADAVASIHVCSEWRETYPHRGQGHAGQRVPERMEGRRFGDLMGCDIARIDTRARLRSISLPPRPGRVADR